MMGPLLLLAIVVIVAVVVARLAGSRRDQPVTGGAGPEAEQPDRSEQRVAVGALGVAEALPRWVEAGLLSEEQSSAILAYEHRMTSAEEVAPLGEPVPGRRSRVPVAAEALGYLGGVLAIVGLGLVVARAWPDMSTAGRLALSGGVAVALTVAGALVHEGSDPALARLRWFLWLASTAATALFVGVLWADGLDAGPTTVVLACGGAVMLQSGLLWGQRERPLQQLTFLGGVAVFAGALVAEFLPDGVVGLAVWLVGAAFLIIGLGRRGPLPLLTATVGAVTVVVGAVITASAGQGVGLVFLVATAAGLLVLAAVPGLAPGRAEQLTVAVVGGVALVQAVPSTLGYFSEHAGVLTGLVTWAIGGILVFVGARQLVRLPIVAEAVGAAAIVGGAALTGVQSPGFASIFGIATAIGLIVLGMLSGHIVLSAFGSLGLLVNVPWAVGWFFPGEGRAPLLILVAGVVILTIAVLLTRRSSRTHGDADGFGHRGPPPGRVPGSSR